MRTPQTRLAPPIRRAPPGQHSRTAARLIPGPCGQPGSDANHDHHDASTVNAPAGRAFHDPALSAQRLPGPRLTPQRRLFPGRSPRQSSANAARGGLKPPPDGRLRGATTLIIHTARQETTQLLTKRPPVFDAHPHMIMAIPRPARQRPRPAARQPGAQVDPEACSDSRCPCGAQGKWHCVVPCPAASLSTVFKDYRLRAGSPPFMRG
jgi:hypothetical protein